MKKVLTHSLLLCYIRLAMEAVFFLCLKKANWCIYTPAKNKKIGGGSCAREDYIGMYRM